MDALMDKAMSFIGLEFYTFAGRVNFCGFLITIATIGTKGVRTCIIWILEWIAFLVCPQSKMDKLKPPKFPADKNPYLSLIAFAGLILCLLFLEKAVK